MAVRRLLIGGQQGRWSGARKTMDAAQMIASLRAEIVASEASRTAPVAPGHAAGHALWVNLEIEIATNKIAEIEADPQGWELRCAASRGNLAAVLGAWSWL